MSAPNVTDIISEILRREGGYVDHPDDKGGPTNRGVTQETLSGWLGRPATVEDVKNLSEETAREIYEKNYLKGPKIDELPAPIMPFVFDSAVNHGPRNAVRMMQEVVNQSDCGPISADGYMGPNTRKGAEATQEKLGAGFLAALCEERRRFYRRIIERDPSQKAFEKGWMNRVAEFEPEEPGSTALA